MAVTRQIGSGYAGGDIKQAADSLDQVKPYIGYVRTTQPLV